MQVTKLERFKVAKLKSEVHQYKQLVLQFVTYPPISTNALSKSKLATLQGNQNRVLRQANNDTLYSPWFTTEELHRKAKLKQII